MRFFASFVVSERSLDANIFSFSTYELSTVRGPAFPESRKHTRTFTVCLTFKLLGAAVVVGKRVLVIEMASLEDCQNYAEMLERVRFEMLAIMTGKR